MRKLKNSVMLILALLPLITYCLSVYQTGNIISFVDAMELAFGEFGIFFVDIITPLLTSFVPLTNTAGVELFAWLIGYYVVLLFVTIVFNLFTFLVTMVMDQIDKIKGNK